MKPFYFQGAVYFDGLNIVPHGAIEITTAELNEFLFAKQEGLSIGTGDEGKPSYSAPPAPQFSASVFCGAVDAEADAARLELVGDPMRAVERDLAASEAQAFKDSGYTGEVPRAVAAWAINGRTAQQAADNILAEAAFYTEALYVIREIRLAAKEQIRGLMVSGEVEEARQVSDQAVSAIQAFVTPVNHV